jgi:hypothetical protein
MYAMFIEFCCGIVGPVDLGLEPPDSGSDRLETCADLSVIWRLTSQPGLFALNAVLTKSSLELLESLRAYD